MKYLIISVLTFVCAGVASAADWTTTETGNTSCGAIRPGGTCYLTSIGEDSSVISVKACKNWTIVVYGTGVSVMPQACTDTSCSATENLLAAVLTGDSPNTFVTSSATFDLVRIDHTSGTPTISITCGG